MTDDDLTEKEPDDGNGGDNAADPKSIAKKKLRTKERSRRTQEWWRAQLQSEDGRREIWALLVSAGTFEIPFQCGPNGFPQPDATMFALGAAKWGLTLYHALIRFDPAGVIAMHAENDTRPNQLDI